jgi:precorrin-2/cobalt-factor-2 C20-methyltransferase
MTRKLYAIGLGPGDPELLTVKAQRLLGEVDVIFLPVREKHDSVSRKIVEQWVDVSRLQELSFRMSRNPQENRERWREHAATIATTLESGQNVAFVTEGDPLLYSTFVHVYSELMREYPDLPVEIVPGVSSVTVGAAAVHLPLVDERERLAIVPATGEVMHAVATFDTVVILKVSMAVDVVLKALDVTGRTGDAIYVERAGWPEQRIIEDVPLLRKERKLDYFGQIIVSRRR